MFLIIGLGNPGQEFDNTPHNIGFMAMDRFQEENNFPAFALSKKYKALISRGDIDGQKVVLAKPQTFMNNSGQSVKGLAINYKWFGTAHHLFDPEPQSRRPRIVEGLPTINLVVIHDDLALPLGQLKVSQNRGAGGHKGVKSIIDHLKTKDFTRIRIGVQPADSAEKQTSRQKEKDGKDLVLQKFTEKNGTTIGQSLTMAIQVLKAIINDGPQKAMNKHN